MKLANDLRAELLPFCDRVWTAGSVRRRKEFVGDVELVCIPKPGIGQSEPLNPEGQGALFGAPTPRLKPLPVDDQLTVYLAEKTSDPDSPWKLRPDRNGRTSYGLKNKFLTYNGSPIDVFSGTWATFGMLFFVRTGDAGWVKEVMAKFKRNDRHAHPYGGVEFFVQVGHGTRNAITAEYLCQTEERVFELLKWPFTNPVDRTQEEARRLRRTHH